MKQLLTFASLLVALVGGLAIAPTTAFAKLPVPPPTPEAKAKADQAAAKTAWTAKVDTYRLCQAQTRVALHYRQQAAAAGRSVAPPTPTPPCVDPGPFDHATQ